MESNENNEYEYEILSEDYPNYDLSFKIIIIGNSGVEKEYLVPKSSSVKKFENYNATVVLNFFSFNMRYDYKIIKLQIWQTCGRSVITIVFIKMFLLQL